MNNVCNPTRGVLFLCFQVAAAPWQMTRERFSADFAHPGQAERGSPSTLESHSPGAGLLVDILQQDLYDEKR